jgi:hypothetical protein
MVKTKRLQIPEPGQDPRELPAYSLTEAAKYLRMPEATLRSWVVGRSYPITAGERFFTPVIQLPEIGSPVLSFVNMVEAHVLDAIRRQENIALRKVRASVAFLKRHYKSRHPLVGISSRRMASICSSRRLAC